MNILITFTGILCWLFIALFILGRIWRYFKSRPKLDINGRYILVTGCDSGFGLGVVEQLIAKGASVIAFTYTKEGANRALQVGAKAAHYFDITDQDALKTAVSQVLELCQGKLWGVVHNAGIVQPGFIEYQPMDNYRRVMDVNFFAVAALTQQLIPALKASTGRVVLISSVDGIVSLPGNAPYDASKFSIEAYADALRVELSFWNVQVSVVNPATMRTPMALSFFDEHKKAWDAMDQLNPEGEWKKAWSREWLDNYIADNGERIERIAQDPKFAINDILHALTAKHPHMRYLSGTLAKTLFYALWKMPEKWSFVFKKSSVNPPPRV